VNYWFSFFSASDEAGKMFLPWSKSQIITLIESWIIAGQFGACFYDEVPKSCGEQSIDHVLVFSHDDVVQKLPD
jgi:hypothetical protein